MSFAGTNINALAGSGAKKLNEGLPLERGEISSLTALFLDNQYFAHIKFGIENGRLEPEEVIKNIRKEDIEKFDFLLLLGYLLRNGLDPNYYFEGPYKISVHIAVFIDTLIQGSDYRAYVFQILQDSGSNFLSDAYRGGRSDGKTVDSIINFQPVTNTDLNIGSYIYSGTNPSVVNLEWKIISSVILDKNLDISSMNVISQNPLMLLTLFNMVVTASSVRLIENSEVACFFWNTYGGMQQSIYLTINGQNLDMFERILDKGAEMNYISMTELICRYNLSSGDEILKDTYGKMISYSIRTGSHIDNNQLQMLSLEGTVDLIEKIREDYRNPEWKKLCKRTFVKSGFANRRLRQIAFDLNIDFGLSSSDICNKLEKISNIDRLAYFNTAVERQKDRIARSLMDAGEVREGDSLDRFRCNVKTTLINNPYAYNDGRVSFYVDSKGELWCFTSDLFDSLIATGINPYTKQRLPDSFLETIKSQVNVLEFLGLKKSKDQRSIDDSLKEVFDSKNEISNTASTEMYNNFVNQMAIIAKASESDIRGKIKPSNIKQVMESFLNLSFVYFSDCKNVIRLDYTPNGNISDIKNINPKNFKSIPLNFKFKELNFYKKYQGMKMNDYLRDGKFVETFYAVVACQFKHFMDKILKSQTDKKENFYNSDSTTLLQTIIDGTLL